MSEVVKNTEQQYCNSFDEKTTPTKGKTQKR